MKTELRIIFLADDGKAFITEEEAENYNNNKQQVKRKNTMTIVELIKSVLDKKNWGIYYKSKPVQNLQVQDGVPLFRVNEVDSESINHALEFELNEIEERVKACTQQSDSQTESKQKES